MHSSKTSAFSLAMAAFASSALAEPSSNERPPAEALLPKVAVTGSNIPRIDAETAMPTLVIRREEIQRIGANTVKELVDSITSSSQIQLGSNRTLSDITSRNTSFASGASSMSMRHLGPQSTLVLLNSRRLAPFAMDDDPGMFVNLDTLPLDAIDRVEVLRSGASAIYGSDAVAGVINIITRRNYRGLQARVSQEQSRAARDFRSSTASLTAGFGDASDDGYNLLVNLELHKRSSVMWREVLGQVNPETTRYSPGFGSESTYSHPGNVIGAGPVPGCAPERIRDGLCFYDRYSRLQAQPAAERASLLMSGEKSLDRGLKAFAEVLYASTETRYIESFPVYGPSLLSTWFNPSSGQPQYFIGRGLPKEHPLNPTGLDDAEFRYRFVDANSAFSVRSTHYRLMTGLRGTLNGFDWESAVGTMGGTSDNRQRGLYSDSGFRQLIGDYTVPQDPLFFNRGYRIGQPNSEAVLGTLFPEYGHRGTIGQTFVDGKVSGPIGAWQGRPVEMAAGFDLRRERLTITPSANLAAGDIVDFGMAQTDGRRTFGSVFGELSVPLTEQLEVQTAARLDKYPGFGLNLSPKAGLRFEASPQWLLRSTVEGGFRAPNLTENSNSTRYSVDGAISDPKRCPQAQALATALYNQAAALPDGDPAKAIAVARADNILGQECSRTVPAIRNSNPDLQPEKSIMATLGLVFQPAQGYLASVDYWRISRRNEIGYKSPQDLFNAEDTLPGGSVNRQEPGNDPSFSDQERIDYGVTAEPLSWSRSRFENTAKTTTSGIDFGVQSRTLTALGTLTGGAQATYLIDYRVFSPLRGGYGDNLAGRYNYPRWRGALSLALASGPFHNAFRLNVLSGTKLQGDFYDTTYSDDACLSYGWTIGDCRVRRSTSVDYSFAYKGVRDLVFSVFVRNLFNQRPPVDLRAFNESGGGLIPQSLADVQRRSMRVALEYKFF